MFLVYIEFFFTNSIIYFVVSTHLFMDYLSIAKWAFSNCYGDFLGVCPQTHNVLLLLLWKLFKDFTSTYVLEYETTRKPRFW